MSRPTTWYPLASSDPVPGDPAAVRAGGQHYEQVATAIADAERVLRALVDAQDAVSDAVDAIRERTHAVADRIRSAHRRYRSVGAALSTYAIELDGAQEESLAALRTAQAAQHRLDVAEDAVRRWRTLAEDAADLGEDDAVQQRALTAARSDRDDAEITLAHARTALDEAVSRRDAAARWTMDAIDAGTQDTLHDGWWEDWGADVAQVVSTWAGRVATGAGLLTLMLGWVPFIGQILAVTAVLASAAALAADLALAVKRGDGQDWFNVATGVLGFISFGASRYIGQAVKAFDVTARTALAQAGTQASRSLLGKLSRLLLRTGRAPLSEMPAELAWTSSRPLGIGGWSDVIRLRGMDRILALAGHGDLVMLNNHLRAQLWQAFPFRPRAFLTLVGPTAHGAALEVGTAVLYVGDGALTLTSIVKEVVDRVVGPTPTPAERIEL